ncbi:hypothetical protein INR49_014789 [Caranx melampygus]|nr:hypothetical protein INR49_014789 [Caranx melampygus]
MWQFSEMTTDIADELGELVKDVSNGQSYDQQPTDDAERTYHLPSKRNGDCVPVAHRGHADGGPPPADGDCLQHRVLRVLFYKVNEDGEHGNADRQEKHQLPNLTGAVSQCGTKRAEASRMAGQL